MSNALIIWASSRPNGNTYKTVEAIKSHTDAEDLDISNANMSFFDYKENNLNDDFLKISQKLLDFKTIVFATPVYWYSMCAQMKIFFDRTSDLLGPSKDIGQALKGKSTFLIANGTGEIIPEGFEIPFSLTSNYFDMNYKGAHYCHTGKNETLKTNTWNKIETFAERIKDA